MRLLILLALLISFAPDDVAFAQLSGTGDYHIVWEVKNRFRLFRREADFLRQVAASRGDGVLAAEQRLAIEQGALDGDCGSYSSIPLEWIDKKLVHAFVRFTHKRVDEIPESAVYIGTFAKGDEQQQLLNLLNGGDEVGRPFIMSKEVPADHLAIIRKAFDDTMKDPAFLAEMGKQQLPVHPLTGEQAETIVNGLVDVPPAIVAQAKPLYE